MSTPSQHVRPSIATLAAAVAAANAAKRLGGGQGPVLQPGDVTIPGQEPMVAIKELPKDSGQTDDPVDANRAEQQQASLPALAIYLAEKYFWKQAKGGRHYLSPLAHYLKYVEEAAYKAAEFGVGIVFPDGARDKTDEAMHAGELAEHIKEMHFSLQALDPKEAESFERYWIDRATRNAVYAATTQFELENWAARSAAKGDDPSNHQNFGEKESRLENFARKAGVGLAILLEAYPASNNYGPDAFAKAARRVIYDAADMETSRLLTPQQLTEQQQAGADAAKATVKRF